MFWAVFVARWLHTFFLRELEWQCNGMQHCPRMAPALHDPDPESRPSKSFQPDPKWQMKSSRFGSGIFGISSPCAQTIAKMMATAHGICLWVYISELTKQKTSICFVPITFNQIFTSPPPLMLWSVLKDVLMHIWCPLDQEMQSKCFFLKFRARA